MYVAALAAIVGQALLLGRLAQLLYATAVWLVAATFVRFKEKPTLTRRFGADYEAYRCAVSACWPRLRPWNPDEKGRGLADSRSNRAGIYDVGPRQSGRDPRYHISGDSYGKGEATCPMTRCSGPGFPKRVDVVAVGGCIIGPEGYWPILYAPARHSR